MAEFIPEDCHRLSSTNPAQRSARCSSPSLLRDTKTQKTLEFCPTRPQPPTLPWVQLSPPGLPWRSKAHGGCSYRGPTAESLAQKVVYSFLTKAALKVDYNQYYMVKSIAYSSREEAIWFWEVEAQRPSGTVLQLPLPVLEALISGTPKNLLCRNTPVFRWVGDLISVHELADFCNSLLFTQSLSTSAEHARKNTTPLKRQSSSLITENKSNPWQKRSGHTVLHLAEETTTNNSCETKHQIYGRPYLNSRKLLNKPGQQRVKCKQDVFPQNQTQELAHISFKRFRISRLR